MAKHPKPSWPHKQYGTLTAHSNGQWCKKRRGRLYYFGPWNDPDTALKRWMAFARGEQAQQPRAIGPTVTLEEAIFQYLDSRRQDVDRKQLTLKHLSEYVRIGELITKTMGREILLAEINPHHFSSLRQLLPGGVWRQRNGIRWCKTIFHWISGTHNVHFRFGPDFKPPRIALARAIRRQTILSPKQIRDAIGRSSPALAAAILLGINGGFGAKDFASMTVEDVDLNKKIINCIRQKTGVHRVVPLWPETVTALKRCRTEGPLWCTNRNGLAWVRESESQVLRPGLRVTRHDGLRLELARKKIDWSLYDLRHTFRTVAGETGDIEAVRLIMGHAVPGVDEHYVHVNEERCRKIVTYVRKWFKTT